MKLLPGFLLILILTYPLQQIPNNSKPVAGRELKEFFPGSEIQLFQVVPFYRKTAPDDEAGISFIDPSGNIYFRDAAAKIRLDRKLKEGTEEAKLQLKLTNRMGYLVNQEKDRIFFSPQEQDLPLIKLDLSRKELEIGGETLDFDQLVEVHSTNNVFHSAWKGYSWKSNNVKLCLGRLQQGNQLFLQIRLSGRNNDLLFMQRKVSRT